MSINFVNLTLWVPVLPFLNLDETQEQHIGHCKSAIFNEPVEICLTDRGLFFVYICEL